MTRFRRSLRLDNEGLSQSLVQIQQTLGQLKSHLSSVHDDLSVHETKSHKLGEEMIDLLKKSEDLAVRLIES